MLVWGAGKIKSKKDYIDGFSHYLLRLRVCLVIVFV